VSLRYISAIFGRSSFGCSFASSASSLAVRGVVQLGERLLRGWVRASGEGER